MKSLMSRLSGLRKSCPVPPPGSTPVSRNRALRLYLPLISFVVPTVVMGYGFVIPRSCIAGWNALSFGFGTTVLGACIAYLAGIRAARRG